MDKGSAMTPPRETRMIHLRVDDWWNAGDYGDLVRGPHFRMACGMRQLSSGHAWTDDTKVASLHVNCPTCLPQCQRLGTPFSELSGRPGEPGYSEFVRIGKSWGYP